MRETRMVAFVILAGVFGCARQSGPRFPAPTGIEKSVYPIYVLGEQVTTINGLKRRQSLVDHRGCSAFYAAPHLLVTSSTALFFNSNNKDLSAFDISKVIIMDGSRQLSVKDVVYADAETGLAVIRTAEAGTPLALRPDSELIPERLDFIGFSFEPVNSFQTLALPHWKSGPVYPVDTAAVFIENMPYFMAKAEIFTGMCGAVVFDSDQRVAGLVHRRHANRVSIITASAIHKAMQEVLDE